MESRILGFGIQNTAQGIQNPTGDWNAGSKFHQQGFWNPVPKNRPLVQWCNFTATTRILQGFAFLCNLMLLLFKPCWNYQIKIWKEQQKRILVAVVKWCHHTNGLLEIHAAWNPESSTVLDFLSRAILLMTIGTSTIFFSLTICVWPCMYIV